MKLLPPRPVRTLLLQVLPIYLSTIVLAYLVHESMVPATPPAPPVVEETEPPPPTEPEFLTQEEALQTITAEELKGWLYTIGGDEYEGRGTGQPGYDKAVEFVETKCKGWGLQTERQPFSTGRGTTENIFAYIEGSDPVKKDEVVVIGAHLDHLGKRGNAIYNGADDNGSGSVGLLAIAKAFSEMGPQPRTVVFQWYGAEEMGLVGSRFYCNNPTFPKSKPNIRGHIAMINLDMIGRLGSGTYRVGWHTGQSSVDLAADVEELGREYPFAKRITSYRAGGSDHASFYNKRVPVAFLHTGGHSDYHKTTDDPDRVNYDGLEDISRFAFELAWKVVHTDTAPKFNSKSFTPMADVYDHGNPRTPFVRPKETQQTTGCQPCRRPRLRWRR